MPPLACFRVQYFASLAAAAASYSAQFYDLRRLPTFPDERAGASGYLELGRFCTAPDTINADVLRLAWGFLARMVDLCGAGMVFGCSSFEGTDPAPFAGAFGLLAARHAPGRVTAGAALSETLALSDLDAPKDHRAALAQIPPLLRSYLSMGGWVSDEAVIDRDMNTLHVFTALEIAKIPERRAKALRLIGQSS